MSEDDKFKKIRRAIIIALVMIAIIALVVTLWAVFFRDKDTIQDYAPQHIEQNAEAIGDKGDKLNEENGGGAVSLTYSKTVKLSLTKKEAILNFQNPYKSNECMKLKLVIDGKTIVESGRLDPGYKVEKLSNVDTEKLAAGKYDGKIVVSYYYVDTQEKAIVNTEIPVIITALEK